MRRGLSILFLAAILPCLSASAWAEGSAAAPSAPQSVAVSDLKEAQARLAKASSPADYRVLLEAFSTSLSPSDALSLLAQSLPSLSQAERYPFLVKSGDLSLLLGLFEDASSRYAEASALAPGGKDPALLLRSARCALAAGDPERASSSAADILIGSADPLLSAQARLVSAWSFLAESRAADARAVASAVAASSGAAAAEGARREARFILWLCAEGGEKASLAAALSSAFPGSPEALIASGSASAPPLPHWYLGALGSSLAKKPSLAPGAPSPAAGASASASASPTGPAAPATLTSPAALAPQKSAGKRLQIGYFSVEDNAQSLKDELSSKGFSPTIEERLRAAKAGEAPVKRWVVTVDAGADMPKTMQRLKDAGYEAYVID
jgi:hypothetical protein